MIVIIMAIIKEGGNKMNQATLEEKIKDIMLINCQLKRDIEKLINLTKVLDTVGDVTLDNWEDFDKKLEDIIDNLEIIEL
jgi:nitrogenase subunit NifH